LGCYHNKAKTLKNKRGNPFGFFSILLSFSEFQTIRKTTESASGNNTTLTRKTKDQTPIGLKTKVRKICPRGFKDIHQTPDIEADTAI